MHLITFLFDPALHTLVIILCLVASAAFAQTAPYVCPSGQMVNSQLANTGASCASLAYSNLTGTPTIPTAQVNSDWNASSGIAQILNKPTNLSSFTNGPGYITSSSLPSCYDGITKHSNCISYSTVGTVASGIITVNLTSDGTSAGLSIFPNAIIMDSINIICNDATLPYSTGYTLSNNNKTLTSTINKSSGILTVLGLSVLGAPVSANGSTCNIQALGY